MKALLLVALACALVPTGQAMAIDTVAPADPVIEAPSDPEPWIAEYEGQQIDLRFGWDGARACETNGVETVCYDTEAEMLAANGPLPGEPGAGASGFRRASCGSYLRLYTGTNYTGSVLALTTQYVVLNLSSYGFNNVTSSYKIGGCSADFWDLSSAGGTVYGGATWAWAQAGSMNSGWDNRISSIYIG